MTTKNDIHQKAVEFAACYLIESGVPTRAGPGRGIDLILDNGETILVRGIIQIIQIINELFFKTLKVLNHNLYILPLTDILLHRK